LLTEWSSTYARQPEILEYLKKVATKYDLYSNTKFNHKVKTATWDEGAKKWKIVVHDMKEDKVLELVYDIV
jgi:cation diffusion facilitator CzcD-associated flavoprotein CzcO